LNHYLQLSLQIVYVIIGIACWYYPNPDVATSNGLEDGAAELVNLTISREALEHLKRLLEASG